MEGWAQGSMGDSSYLNFLPGSQEFGVFLRVGKSALFRLLGPAQTQIPEMGSGSECLDTPTKVKDLGFEHDGPALFPPGPAPESSCLKRFSG